MAEYSKIQLIGRLTADPETKNTNDRPLGRLRIAVNRKRRGEEKTTYYTVFTYGRTAQACEQFLTKGSQVFVNGEPEQSIYQGNDGTPKLDLTVSADSVVFLDPPKQKNEQPKRGNGGGWGEPQPASAGGGWNGGGDPIPF